MVEHQWKPMVGHERQLMAGRGLKLMGEHFELLV
jgi:hypothetical protein